MQKNYIESDTRLKSDTNQLQYNFNPALLAQPKTNSTAQLVWCCCAGCRFMDCHKALSDSL